MKRAWQWLPSWLARRTPAVRAALALGAAVLLGAGFGVATSGFAIDDPNYFVSLIALLVTLLGFLLIAIVFVYEQQRQAWRLSFRIRDGRRAIVLSGAATTILLALVAAGLGLAQLSGAAPAGGRLGALLVAAAASTAFAAIVAGPVCLVLVVRMLTSASLAERIIANPDALVGTAGGSVEPASAAEELMRLALSDQRADEFNEYRQRVEALVRLGSMPRHTLAAAEQLLDLAGLIGGHARRDYVKVALDAVQKLLTPKWRGSDEAMRLLRKVASTLRHELSTERPSARLVRAELELVYAIGGTYNVAGPVLHEALLSCAGRSEPADIWEVLCDIVIEGVGRDDVQWFRPEVATGWLNEVLREAASLDSLMRLEPVATGPEDLADVELTEHDLLILLPSL